MRTNEERIAAVKRRISEMEQQSRRRRGRMIRLSSVAACLALIVGLSFALPDSIGNFAEDAHGYSAMTASVFQGSGALGLIVIGLLAFALGVCVTLLCHHTRRMEREQGAEKTQRENDDD